ncbi:MAG: hypothetical protein AAFO84_01700 [Cyanobacteria bacterium J06598_1]
MAMKVFIVGLTIAAAVVGAGIGYASLQTGATPVWQRSDEAADSSEAIESVGTDADPDASYKKESARVSGNPDSANSDAGARPSDAKPRAVGASDIVISEAELNQRVSEALASDPKIAPILDITKDGVTTNIEGDRIESGITVNLSELPLDELPAEAQDAVSEMINAFPFLAKRDVYIGIEGSPKIVDSAVSLDDTNIKFGPLKLPVSNVATQLGVSQTDIEQQLNILLEQQGLTPEDIQIADGQIVITGVL